jgi:hypothetical protein
MDNPGAMRRNIASARWHANVQKLAVSGRPGHGFDVPSLAEFGSGREPNPRRGAHICGDQPSEALAEESADALK